MKKMIATLLLLAIGVAGTTTYVMAGGGGYTKVIESCWGPIQFPDGSIGYTPGGRYVMACLPAGNDSCAQEICLGPIR